MIECCPFFDIVNSNCVWLFAVQSCGVDCMEKTQKLTVIRFFAAVQGILLSVWPWASAGVWFVWTPERRNLQLPSTSSLTVLSVICVRVYAKNGNEKKDDDLKHIILFGGRGAEGRNLFFYAHSARAVMLGWWISWSKGPVYEEKLNYRLPMFIENISVGYTFYFCVWSWN